VIDPADIDRRAAAIAAQRVAMHATAVIEADDDGDEDDE